MATNIISKEKPPLPSTADEIPLSDVRKQPLSSEELRDIRSLIGIAKGSSRAGDVADASPQPLAGRRLMVPVTSKAFFEGILQPPTKATDSTKADAMNEQIIVNKGGKLVEMTRAEAGDLFETSKKSGSVNDTKPLAKKASLKSGKTSNTSKKATPASTQSETSADPMMPLMEIRETCDDSGNIINSEIVNVSNTMKRLGDGLDNATGAEEDDGKQFGELLAQTLKEGESDITKDVHKTYTGGDEEGKEEIAEETEKGNEPISDAAYNSLCSRLEELERLEEEDATSKVVNAKSSKRLQSSGWSTGFLNNTKKKGAPRRKSSTKKNEETNLRVSFSKDSGIKDIPIPNASSEKASKVSFSSDNEIKEIPRIGQTKVPPRPTTAAPRSVTFNNTNLEVPQMDPLAPNSTVPFEENIFRGVVKERNASLPDSVGEATEAKASAPNDGGDGMGGKKKLSRFAQQRLERENR